MTGDRGNWTWRDRLGKGSYCSARRMVELPNVIELRSHGPIVEFTV